MPKVVFITGGSSGIGKAIGEYLTAKGYKVYGTSRSPEKHAGKTPFSLLEMDVTKEDTIEEAIAHVIEREGLIQHQTQIYRSSIPIRSYSTMVLTSKR